MAASSSPRRGGGAFASAAASTRYGVSKRSRAGSSCADELLQLGALRLQVERRLQRRPGPRPAAPRAGAAGRAARAPPARRARAAPPPGSRPRPPRRARWRRAGRRAAGAGRDRRGRAAWRRRAAPGRRRASPRWRWQRDQRRPGLRVVVPERRAAFRYAAHGLLGPVELPRGPGRELDGAGLVRELLGQPQELDLPAGRVARPAPRPGPARPGARPSRASRRRSGRAGGPPRAACPRRSSSSASARRATGFAGSARSAASRNSRRRFWSWSSRRAASSCAPASPGRSSAARRASRAAACSPDVLGELLAQGATARSMRALPSAAPFARRRPARERRHQRLDAASGAAPGRRRAAEAGGMAAGPVAMGSPAGSVSRTAKAISPWSWASFTRIRFGPLRSVTSTTAWSSRAGW